MTEVVKQLGVSETRNSALREKTAHFTAGLAKVIDKTIPGLTPTHLNILGALAVAAGTAIAASRDGKNPRQDKNKTIVSAFLLAIGSGLDGVDGPLARRKAQIDPSAVDFKKGQIYDALGDRAQETSEANGRQIEAHKRGSKLGELAATATASSNAFSSITRALSESLGKPVPETGRGVLGLVGTRVGRAVAGMVATVAPEINGIPLQPAIDVLMTTSNLKTTVDRLMVIKNGESTLPLETRKDAQDRLKAMVAAGALAIGASAYTYWRLNRVNQRQPDKLLPANGDFLNIVQRIEQYCLDQGLDHRIVGGTLTDFIGPKTEYEIDIVNRRIILSNPQSVSLFRPDGTEKDVDLVMFSPDRARLQQAKQEFKGWGMKAKKEGRPFPYISLEAARHPQWPPRSKLKQLVTAFEYDQNGHPHLVFGSTDQPIKLSSLEPWTVAVGDGLELTTFNPIAHSLCYALRTASGVKMKDKVVIGTYEESEGRKYNKMGMIGRLAHDVLEAGREKGIDYKNDSFKEWIDYIHTLTQNPDGLTGLKAKIILLYWNTIGTQVSHGAGIFYRVSHLSNRFTG